MSIEDDWVRAFARQADADFRAWELYQKHPVAVSAECRPDNCEYPWEYGGQVLSPLDRIFYLSNLLTIPSGTTFLKSLRLAINRILTSSAP